MILALEILPALGTTIGFQQLKECSLLLSPGFPSMLLTPWHFECMYRWLLPLHNFCFPKRDSKMPSIERYIPVSEVLKYERCESFSRWNKILLVLRKQKCMPSQRWYTNVHSTAIHNNPKLETHLPTSKGVNKLWYIHVTEYYSATEGNERP